MRIPNVIGTIDGWLRRRPRVRKRPIDRLEDITAHTFRLWLEREYEGHYKYLSEEEDEYGNTVISGVYILKNYLPRRPPKYLTVDFGQALQ